MAARLTEIVVDAYQAAGTVPMDLVGWHADFAVGGSVKWLCGGPGAGYLYVRPDLAKTLKPAFVGWAAHEAPFAFATGEIPCFPRASPRLPEPGPEPEFLVAIGLETSDSPPAQRSTAHYRVEHRLH